MMAALPAVVIVTDALSLSASVILRVLEAFEDKVDGGKRLAVITQVSSLGPELKLEASSIDAVVSVSEKPGFHSRARFTDIMKVLKPGGIVLVEEEAQLQSVKSSVETELLLAGFINSQHCHGYAEGVVAIKAVKPTWETGISFSLKKRAITLGSTGATAVKLPTFNADDEYDLIDEDSLLTEDDLKRPELPKADDCEVGKAGKKACKNCTCGRAEMEISGKVSLTTEGLDNPQSACGSCGLGDAFRCSTCPYKGMPPFKPGEKITLSGMLLTADV